MSARVQQAPDAPQLPPRNSSPPPRPPRRDQTLPRMHSASLLHAHLPPEVPPPRRNSSVDSPPLPPPPPPATLPRRLPATGDVAAEAFTRMGMTVDRGERDGGMERERGRGREGRGGSGRGRGEKKGGIRG